jgi:hypothetical protein
MISSHHTRFPLCKSTSGMARLVLCLLASLTTILVIWCTRLPLGLPEQWTWQRTEIANDFWWSLLPACVSLGLLGTYVFYLSEYFDDARKTSRGFRCVLLIGLAVLSFFSLSGLQEAAHPQYRSAKTAFVLYFAGSSGYFTEARKVRNTREFLTEYAETLKEGDVLHQGTHPPGLIVGYRCLMWLCQTSWFRQFLLGTQPADLRDALRIISEQLQSGGRPPLSEHDRSVLWLASLLMQACAAATVIPLYALLHLHAKRTTSWLVSSFWPLVPAISIFLPKSDDCLPFLGCTVLAFWLYGLKKQSIVLCFAAGATFWLGMTLSLALLPVACLAGLLTAWYLWACGARESWSSPGRRLIMGLLAGGTGFLLLTALLWFGTGCNLISVWIRNYHNHAGFYLQYPRTYWKWLLINPLELAFAVGLPITVLVIGGTIRALRQPRVIAHGPAIASLSTWSLLWISGKNMGEAARLWIFLMPRLIWTAAADWDPATDQMSLKTQRRYWIFCWACQVVATIATISRVVGFHL